jgi:hypothetical protein
MKYGVLSILWGVCVLVAGFAATLFLMGGNDNLPLMIAFSGIGAIICFSVMLFLLLSIPQLSSRGRIGLGTLISTFVISALILFVVTFGSGQPFWLMFALKTIPQLLPLMLGCCYFAQQLFDVWVAQHHAHLSDMF